MSGPKDAEYILAEIVLAAIASQRMAHEAAWAGRVESLRPIVKKERPAPRAAMAAAHPAVVRRQQASRATPEEPAGPPKPSVEEVAAAFSETVAELEVRGRALAADEMASDICRTEVTAWNERRLEHAAMDPSPEAVAAGQELIGQANAIVARAFAIAEQRDKREYVLKAIVESLHAVGYFTDEPLRPDSSDPAAPIAIVARKGGDQVSISLPLGEDVVRSSWDGFAGDKCVDSFMDYVAAMGERGVACTPCDQALRDRPKLRQAGRKDLPRSGTAGA